MSVSKYEQVVPCRYEDEVVAVQTALRELSEAILKSPADDGLAKSAYEAVEKARDAINTDLLLAVINYGHPDNLKPRTPTLGDVIKAEEAGIDMTEKITDTEQTPEQWDLKMRQAAEKHGLDFETTSVWTLVELVED